MTCLSPHRPTDSRLGTVCHLPPISRGDARRPEIRETQRPSETPPAPPGGNTGRREEVGGGESTPIDDQPTSSGGARTLRADCCFSYHDDGSIGSWSGASGHSEGGSDACALVSLDKHGGVNRPSRVGRRR